jgi:ribose transport system permease protein
LAMMGIVKGFGIIIAGSGIVSYDTKFNSLGQGKLLGIPMLIWFMIIVVSIFTLLLAKTRYFRKFYYIGGNEKAAILSGINVNALKISGFIITSTLSGLAGIIMAARFGASVAAAGQGLELKVITAVILGGASLSGGQGTIIGALVGTAFMGLVNNLMILSNISVYWQGIIVGMILVLAVVSDVIIKKRTA